MERVYKVEKMSCGHCEAKIDKGLNAIDGVEAKVNLADKEVTVTSELSSDDIVKAISEIGYAAVEL